MSEPGKQGEVVCATCKKHVPKSAALTHEGVDKVKFFCSEYCIDDYMENEKELYYEQALEDETA